MEKGAPVQLEIFDVGWPPHDRFPYNNRMYRVKELVEADLLSTRSPLVITGYASLNTLLDFFARCFSSQAQANPIRILLGHEPFIREHQTYASPHIVLHEQIKQYWLEHRISLYHSMKIILAYERYQFVTDVLGSNLALPTLDETQLVSAQVLAAAVGQEDQKPERESWRFISDAFEPVRRLVTGQESLCPAPLYENMRTSEARVISSVSTVQSLTPWAFFAVAGTEWGAPRWIWLDGPHAKPITDLEQISQALKDYLGAGKGADRAFDTTAASWLTHFLDQLNRTERLLLSKKKQRTLEEMERTLRSYAHDASVLQDTERLEIVQQLLDLFTSTLQEGLSVDWGSLAECWLDVLRPHWYKLLQLPRKRRTRPLLLKDLYPELLADPLSIEQLTRVQQQQLWTKKLDVRVVAAILGVPDEIPVSPSA